MGNVTQKHQHRNESRENDHPVNPASLAAERCVLGALIEDDALLGEVLDSGLRAGHFFLSDNRRIFEAIEALRAKNAPVDYISVVEQLGNRAEDYVVLADLCHGLVIHTDHVLHHAGIIRRKAALRELLKLGEWISQATTETSDPELLIPQIRNLLDDIAEDYGR